MERMVLNLDEQIEAVRAVLEAKNAARENAIEKSRKLVQFCGSAIRAMHRQDWNGAQNLLTTARDALIAMREGVTKYPDLYYAGYFQDAAKEFVEASLTFAMLRDVTLPTPAELQVEEATYLNGLCEAASELRRYVLDILRHDHDLSASEQAEQCTVSLSPSIFRT
jgi:translin